MEKLAPELVRLILEYAVIGSYGSKNYLLELRTTCKMFDEILQPFVLRTLQLEFSRLDKRELSQRPLDNDALRRIGCQSKSLFIDLMVVRDEAEIGFFRQISHFVPSSGSFVSNVQERHCMNEDSFTGIEYHRQLSAILEHTPNVDAIKLNLPLQFMPISIPAHNQQGSATMILANTFKALAQRPEGSETLKTLVLENLVDVSAMRLWRNPQDVKNIVTTFRDLQKLSVSVQRQDHTHVWNAALFSKALWGMIGAAKKLESLCIIDMDTSMAIDADDKASSEVFTTASRQEWSARTLLPPQGLKPKHKIMLQNLACLELRQIQLRGQDLVSILRITAGSLRELYLEGVYLKTVFTAGPINNNHNNEYNNDTCPLWVGLPNTLPPPQHSWIAAHLRQMRLRLRVLRVTDLGYDQYTMANPDDSTVPLPMHDLEDPSGLSRPLSQRFSEIVAGIEQPLGPDGLPTVYLLPETQNDEPEPEPEDNDSALDEPLLANAVAALSFDDDDDDDDDEEIYEGLPTILQSQYSRTPGPQRSIDGQFRNLNPSTVRAMHEITETVTRGLEALKTVDTAPWRRRI
ncbi:hypothetical protein GGR54DRAFT_600650 [Hypoxylon sp. NC1633]|nr:hypothetical protein GGR54DRAFT_600650 [Hypoxylon sp. NC1633]